MEGQAAQRSWCRITLCMLEEQQGERGRRGRGDEEDFAELDPRTPRPGVTIVLGCRGCCPSQALFLPRWDPGCSAGGDTSLLPNSYDMSH